MTIFKPVGALAAHLRRVAVGAGALAAATTGASAAGFPSCDSPQARTTLIDGMKHSIIGEATGLAPVSFSNVQTLRESATELHCHVEAVLNNGADVRITFTFFYDRLGRQFMLFRVFPGANSGPVYGRFSNWTE